MKMLEDDFLYFICSAYLSAPSLTIPEKNMQYMMFMKIKTGKEKPTRLTAFITG